jgi:hypothetical protein
MRFSGLQGEYRGPMFASGKDFYAEGAEKTAKPNNVKT